MPHRILILLLLSLTAGCASAHTASAPELAGMSRRDPLYNLVYVGSDDKYHYINRQIGEKIEHFRIAKSQLDLKPVFPVGEGKSYVLTEATFHMSE
ncbi:MAG TPA: hypothetical protein VFC78_23055 [Tepidisphaeraceae bacterium]|nr:hypothetical protein [Tepidisphaeraceae bacterium]